MSKNSEWGSVAYLSQSKYGKYGNPNYTGADKEVAINNCSNGITGIGGDTVGAVESSTTCTTNTYETEKGQTASTTGNITGIYDMSGGATEYVMVNYDNVMNKDSGFLISNIPEAKYYDFYETTSPTTACDGGICYGHALSETSGWYKDTGWFVDQPSPWFVRGNNYYKTMNAGVFCFSSSDGSVRNYNTARVVGIP